MVTVVCVHACVDMCDSMAWMVTVLLMLLCACVRACIDGGADGDCVGWLSRHTPTGGESHMYGPPDVQLPLAPLRH